MKAIIADIMMELGRAEEEHPDWPEDMVHKAAIVVEEAGELLRAALQYTDEGGSIEDVRMECIQTAAMCIRFLNNLK
jgi:NTP pyrophosphatase (non-canonical NTP hydrolase)